MGDITSDEWALLLATLAMAATASAGVYEGLFVMPKWFADPPKSLSLIQNRSTLKFWIPLQIIGIIFVTWTMIAFWDDRDVHGLLIAALVCYLLVWVSTAVYFVPNVARFSRIDPNGPSSPELAARGRRWLAGTWGRQLLMVASAVLLLMVLAAT